MELPAFAQRRRNAVPLQLGIGALDAEIGNGAGIGTGEVLHLVGGEGGQKTSLALHAAEHYARNGGKVLFVSLDMHPREIELRLMMKLLNCSRDTVLWHAEAWDDRYRQACEARRELDANLSIIGGPLNLAKIKAAILASEAQAVIVDYVTIVNGFNGNELDAARGVTQFVREARDRWGITFVLLSQMSRESVKDVRQGGTGGHAKGGSSLEQLVDYEIELSTDEPLTEGGNRRLIAFLRKNRNGRKGLHFELFPSFPSMSFSERAEPVTRDPAKRKITFRSAW
jgi:KaiC/GvpD/RAD55 family RecA-like ATPase